MEELHSQSKRKGPKNTKKHKESHRKERIKTFKVERDILSSPTNIVENSDGATTSNKNYNEPDFFFSHRKTNARDFSPGCSSSSEIPAKDSVTTDFNISVKEEEWSVDYFQFLLNREMEKLNELCKKWQKIKDKPKTTEDGQYQIHQAIGQTNLLINKKFERFRSLISDCETGKGVMSVTCTDLKGFWDVICIEVRNCNSRFEKIENLRSQGWRELNEKFPSKPVAGSMKKRTIARKKVVTERKKKVAQKLNDCDNTKQFRVTGNNVSNKLENKNPIPVHDQNIIRSSLLREVELSVPRIKTPLIVIKISQMCKIPEVQLYNSISYVNSDQTQVKQELAETSAKIKLSFNDSSSEELKDVHDSQQNSQISNIKNVNLFETPYVTVQGATSITQVSSLQRNSKKRNSVDENSKQYEDSPSNDTSEQNKIVRVLRNRTVYSINTPQPKLKSLKNEENKTPRTRRKNTVKATSKDKENIDLGRANDSSKTNKKKQSAKTVKHSSKKVL